MPKSSAHEVIELEVLDLEYLVREYAVFFLDGDKKKDADLDNPVIKWDFMHVDHGDTVYPQTTDYAEPTAHVIFTANFKNDTPNPQTYVLRTDRKTKSTCSLSFKRVYAFGTNLNVKITPPTPVIGATVGFKRQVTKERGVTDSSEQELTWSVDSSVMVPSRHQTEAKLVIKEENYTGDFTIKCTFEGIVLITYQNKETKEHIMTVTASVKNLFKDPKYFILDDQGRPVFVIKGVCKCRYGIEQSVELTESKITVPT